MSAPAVSIPNPMFMYGRGFFFMASTITGATTRTTGQPYERAKNPWPSAVSVRYSCSNPMAEVT
jgi:hypothetical protein